MFIYIAHNHEHHMPISSDAPVHNYLYKSIIQDHRRKYKYRYKRSRSGPTHRKSTHKRCPRPRSKERICLSAWTINLVPSKEASLGTL
jgi:hypothetical protein